jgi:RNA polymerase sigma-70 factor (ECF subfamily)
VRIALKELPIEQVELIRMAFFESLSHSQIAEKTGLPLGTVKSRIRLAFSRLRRHLEANGVDEA